MSAGRPDPAPARRSAHDSHVRLRAQRDDEALALLVEQLHTQDAIDDLCAEHVSLTLTVAQLERWVERASARGDLRPGGPLITLVTLVRDLTSLRAVLGELLALTEEPSVHRLFRPTAALGAYVRSTLDWAAEVAEALLLAVDPSASREEARVRLERVAQRDTREEEDVRRESLARDTMRSAGISRITAPPALGVAVERVFRATASLTACLGSCVGPSA